jgi:hypothetical protein
MLAEVSVELYPFFVGQWLSERWNVVWPVPYVRASNEGSLRPRVARARELPGQPAFFPSFYLGQYIITATPTKHTIAPMTSNRSGST